MSTATRGRRYEYIARDHLIAHGWTHIMRAAASKGPGDLLMAHPQHGGALIQVGATSKRLGPADRERLCDAADLISALPLLFTITRGHIDIRVVDRGKPAGWERFEVGSDA